MRVASKTIYDMIKYNLANITESLYKANKVVATTKRINSISDDPVGLTQCLNIRSSLSNLDQLEKNISMGRTWLNAGKTALATINDLISDAKVLCLQMANASVNATQRADAAELIDGNLGQILSFGNTEINGQYTFAGTKTDIRPFAFDDEANPTKVTYSGNDCPFTIKIGKDTSTAVGRDGEEVFRDQSITIDSSNNKIAFKEDIGYGATYERILTAVIQDGKYTASELAIAIQNAMNEASEDSGYDITYEVSYDTSTKKFTIKDNGAYPAFFGFQLLWDTGDNARVSNINIGGGIPLDDVTVTVNNNAALIHGTPSPPGTAPLQLTWDGTANWAVTNDPGYLLPAHIPGDANGVNIDLDGDTIADITISLSNPATAAGDFVEFDITPASGDYSVGPDLGFNVVDVTYAPSTSDSEFKFYIHAANNMIDFSEDDGVTEKSVSITSGYYSADELAVEIEDKMDIVAGVGIDYNVTYNSETNKFNIAGTGLAELQLLWNTGTSGNSAATTLGFTADATGDTAYTSDSVAMTEIRAGENDAIDFKELPDGGTLSGELNVTITPGNYSTVDLASEIEAKMTAESAASANNIVYDVSYDSITGKFTIKENGTTLDELQILWGTGTNSGTSAATTLGYDTEDDIVTATTSDSEVEWGIFRTLIDLKDYLEANDVDGISRSMTRLDSHLDHFSTTISNTGFKEIQLDIKENLISDLNLNYMDRKSRLEDADIIEAIMELKAREVAYQAALAASARVMGLSLVNYL